MAKMYYTELDAAAKLGVTIPGLAKFTSTGKLRAYADGPRKMYKADEVDRLVAEVNPQAKSETGEIQLTPADTSADVVTLEPAKTSTPPTKEDTVISSEGISIFDTEDLEIEAADPMAKTTIAPSVEDQASAEGVGSGSGLLDLTRESDDTSLGAVLDHIDEGAVAAGESGAQQVRLEAEAGSMSSSMPMMMEPAVEEADRSSGAFSGLVAAAAVLMLAMLLVVVPTMLDQLPSYLEWLYGNASTVLGIGAVVAIAFAVVGFVVGKSAATQNR